MLWLQRIIWRPKPDWTYWPRAATPLMPRWPFQPRFRWSSRSVPGWAAADFFFCTKPRTAATTSSMPARPRRPRQHRKSIWMPRARSIVTAPLTVLGRQAYPVFLRAWCIWPKTTAVCPCPSRWRRPSVLRGKGFPFMRASPMDTAHTAK